MIQTVLRRKFFLHLSPLVVLFLATSIAAIVLLQGILHDMRLAAPGAELEALHARFRWLVIGLSLLFLLEVNFTIVMLMRLAGMILRPMEKLIRATRALALDQMDYRVQIDQHDEFDELAHAYNDLAEKLQSNERKRMEVLGQVALTMNHELNNCVSIIDMQLRLASKQAEKTAGFDRCLRQIDESLRRMTTTVQSLKNVRRIVLTDYIPGMKMLDLQKSLEIEEPERVRMSG